MKENLEDEREKLFLLKEKYMYVCILLHGTIEAQSIS